MLGCKGLSVVRAKSGTWSAAGCVSCALTTFILLWFITGETHGNVEYICFYNKKQDVVNGDIYASALWQIIKMCAGFSLSYKNFHFPVYFFFYFVIVSLLLFFQYQLLFLAPFLPITYCNSLEKWGPCGTVFEKEANKEKVKTNGNKLTCPVPPLPPTLVLQMPERHSSP